METYGNLYVADGFREDCIKLISQFDALDNSSFQNFCTLWNKMKFSFIFGGRASHSELVEFTEEALYIAEEFISSDKSMKSEIGGIYLLYGLFHTMPVSQPKIRVTLDKWKNILRLRNQLLLNKHYDAIYILQQLIEKNAFAYSLSEHERGLENYYLLKDFMNENSRVSKSQSENNKTIKVFVDLDNKTKLYCNKKQKLSNFSDHIVPKIFDVEKAENLLNTIKKLNNKDDSLCQSLLDNKNSLNQSFRNEDYIVSTPSSFKNCSLHIKPDSNDESETSFESDNEYQYS